MNRATVRDLPALLGAMLGLLVLTPAYAARQLMRKVIGR
jgi:hypothetical protein